MIFLFISLSDRLLSDISFHSHISLPPLFLLLFSHFSSILIQMIDTGLPRHAIAAAHVFTMSAARLFSLFTMVSLPLLLFMIDAFHKICAAFVPFAMLPRRAQPPAQPVHAVKTRAMSAAADAMRRRRL
jgi:hypothetical protein